MVACYFEVLLSFLADCNGDEIVVLGGIFFCCRSFLGIDEALKTFDIWFHIPRVGFISALNSEFEGVRVLFRISKFFLLLLLPKLPKDNRRYLLHSLPGGTFKFLPIPGHLLGHSASVAGGVEQFSVYG